MPVEKIQEMTPVNEKKKKERNRDTQFNQKLSLDSLSHMVIVDKEGKLLLI